MGSDYSKFQIVVDHFYYTDEKFSGKLLIDGKIMQKIQSIIISFIGKLSIVLQGNYECVKFCNLSQEIILEKQNNPLELNFTIDLHDKLPSSTYIERKQIKGQIRYYIEVIAKYESMFDKITLEKQISIRQALSQRFAPFEKVQQLPLTHLFKDYGFCLVNLKINKKEFYLGETAEIILDYDNKNGHLDIDYFNIDLIQSISVQEEFTWITENNKLSSQATTGIKQQEQLQSSHIIYLPIIDKKGIFQQNIQTGFMTVSYYIQITARSEYFSKNKFRIPIDICLKESKCSYQMVNSINGIQSNKHLGKVNFDEEKLNENFVVLKTILRTVKMAAQILKK